MPVNVTLDDRLNLVYLDPQGVFTTGEFLESLDAYTQDASFHAKIDVLVDFRGVVEYEVGADNLVEQVAWRIEATRQGETCYRAACVVRSDEEETLVMLSDGVLHQAGEAKAFYKVAEALDWLGHPEAEERVESLRSLARPVGCRAGHG